MVKDMTPKEKAKELVKKFMSIDSDSEKFDGFKMGFFYAQRCALIFINEMLMNPIHLLSNAELYYWNEVKKEIEKL